MAASVPVTPATETAAPSIDDRISSFLGMGESEPAPESEPTAGDEPTPEVPTDELTPEDLDAEPAPDDGLEEIEVQGEKKRLSKADLKKYAQMGFDADQKWKAAGEATREATELRAAVQAKITITPQLIDAAAVIKTVEAAIAPYEKVDWVQLARDDPMAYSQHRAQFDQLRDSWQRATHAYQQVAGAAQQVEQAIDDGALRQQANILLSKIPEYRDYDRLKADQGRIRKYLGSEGITDAELNQMTDARFFLISRKAMLYDQAMSARKAKATPAAPDNAPPSLRPGAAPVRANARAQQQEVVKQLHQAKDPQRRKALFDDALARKMGFK